VDLLFNQIKVLYEDGDVVVIDKPAGLVVTPGPGYSEDKTLVGWLVNRYGEDLRQVGNEAHRPGIVHRLDKDTSGVMIAAKNQDAFLYLTNQFLRKKVKKSYVALLWGDVWTTIRGKVHEDLPIQMIPQYAFTIDAPIGRNPHNRMRKAIVADGKMSVTNYVLKKVTAHADAKMSLVTAQPQTGRTHQIRVHSKSLGHSIVGDVLYQSRNESHKFRMLVDNGAAKRLYLHAKGLAIRLPSSKEVKVFTAPTPHSFKTFLNGM
jgi:23S rRNA pseudouridine1911/1915/1917 synthase